MRRIIHRRVIAIIFPAVRLQIFEINPVGAKSQLAGRAEVCEQGLRDWFIPTIRFEARAGENRGEHRARVVVTVVGLEPRRRDVAPTDETERRMFWVGAYALAHAGIEEGEIEKVRGDDRAL